MISPACPERRRPTFAVIALGLALSGCARRTALPDPLVVAYPAAAQIEELSVALTGNVFETLVDVDPDQALRPALARSWYSPDERTWIFTLRDRIPRHDGGVLTAGDVAQALERERVGKVHGDTLGPVESVEALDATRLRIRTRRVFGPLAMRLARVPVRLASGPGEPSVGTGPYRIRAWDPGRSLGLEAFDSDPARRPAVRRVLFRAVSDHAARVRQLESGSAQLILDVPRADLPRLEKERRLRIVVRPGLRLLFLGMDCASLRSPHVDAPVNPLRDLRVRRALELAIDRSALVRDTLGGQATPALRIWQAGPPGSAPTPPEAGRTEAARRLLVEAGFAAGFTLKLDFTQGRLRDAEDVAQHLVSDLGRIGIRVELRAGPDLLARLRARDTALFLSRMQLAYSEADRYFDSFLHTPRGGAGDLNASGYSNPDVDRWIEEVDASLEHLQRAEIVARIADQIARDLPLIPLVVLSDVYGLDRRLAFSPRADRRIDATSFRWEDTGR